MIGSRFARASLSLLLCFSLTPATAFGLDAATETPAVLDEPTETQTPSNETDESATPEEPAESPAPQELAQPRSGLTGTGTAEDPYLVGSVEDLELLRDIMNAEPSIHVKMTSSISVGEWTPFFPSSGYITEAFSGVFDGCGHSITNMKVNATKANVGFFGGINGATIKNLHVSGTVSSSKSYVGGIVGKMQWGTLVGCSFSGNVSCTKSDGYAGGLIGGSVTTSSSISGCYNAGSVSGGVAGGIVGFAKYTTIESSYNTGAVHGTKRAGGITGQLQNNGSIAHCYNTGTISGSAFASDIVDFLYSSSTIASCGYVARISGDGTGKVDTESCVQSDDPTVLHAILGGTVPGPVDPDDPGPTPGPRPDEPDPDAPPAGDKTLDEIAASLSTLYPEFGRDTNVVEMIRAKHPNITVTLESVEKANAADNCSNIDQTGNITYFYADPDDFRGQWFGSYRITVALSLGDATTEKTIPVTVYWDAQKVKDMLTTDVLSQIGLGDLTNVSTDLSLPKVASGKLWAQITWTSSDPSVISVSTENQGTADTLFAPYVGKVKCGETPKDVTLTAKVVFQRTATGEPEISVEQTYPVHVDSLDGAKSQQIKSELMAKLDAGFSKVGLRDYVTGKQIRPDADGIYTAENDIQLPTTSDFGVDGKHYPITLASSDPEVLTVPEVRNGARVSVLRPMNKSGLTRAASMAGVATLSVSLSDRDTDVKATKEFTIRVKPIELSELMSEYELMEQAKRHYFDGLNADANPSANEVTANLSPFFEVYADNSGKLVWVRDNAQKKNTGIVPVAQNGWEELGLWRLFRSSNAKVVSHENLLVSRQAEPKIVTIKSVLSHEVYGKYGELYAKDPVRYAQYKDFAPLYGQEVSAQVLVRGTNNPSLASARTAAVNANFAVTDGSRVLYSGIYQGLPEGTTAWDVFKQMVPAGKYQHKGSYVSSITGPDGIMLAEKSRGLKSGWLYSVNGTMPNVSLGNYVLENGDELVLFFTDDGSAYGHWEWPNATDGSGAPDPDGTQDPEVLNPDEPLQNPNVPELANWTKVSNVKEGDQVLITSSDGMTRTVQPLMVADDAYVPLASGDSFEVLGTTDGADVVPWWDYWWLILIGAAAGVGITVLARRPKKQ